MPPAFCAWAITCSASVVLPEASGPKISTTRPRGKPPTPSAMSTASEPLGIASTFSPAEAPSFMIEPFPNCFSICWIACSMARDFSLTTTSCSSRSPKERRRLASHRRQSGFAGLWLGVRGGSPWAKRGPPAPSPDLFLFALGFYDLEGHWLDRLHHGLPLELLFELLLGLLFPILVASPASTRRHRSLHRPGGSSRDRSSIAR